MTTRPFAFASLLAVFAGCSQSEPVSESDVHTAIAEVRGLQRAVALPSAFINMSAYEQRDDPEELAAAIASNIEIRLPCAEVTQEGATIDIRYTEDAEDCELAGRTVTGGSHAIVVKSAGNDEAVVDHTFTDFSTDDVTLNGTSTVDYGDRWRVTHDLAWTTDGGSATGSFAIVQGVYANELETGMTLTGIVAWQSGDAAYELQTDGVDMQLDGNVPAGGACALFTPFSEDALEVSFFGGLSDYQELEVETPEGDTYYLGVTARSVDTVVGP